MLLDHKVLVLTGGSSGIGLELLRRLSASNTIINLSRTLPPEEVVAGATSFSQIDTDLADPASVSAAMVACKRQQPDGIDGIINCAAVQFTPTFTDPQFNPSTIATEIAINLTSPIQMIAGLLEALMMRPEAFILNVNSGLGIVPKNESAVYCATKAGLDNFSRGLRAQLAETNIGLLQVFLPLVDTPMTEGRGDGKLSPEHVAARIIDGIERGIADNDIGKVRLLRAIDRISPSLSHRIMQKGAK